MNQPAEWEVVDEGAAPRFRTATPEWMQAKLGRHWKLKAVGLALTGVALLAVILAIAGVFILIMAGVAALSFAISWLKSILRKDGGPDQGYGPDTTPGDWKALR